MRIAIDARMYGQSGVGRYIRNLISGLQKLDRENLYFVLLLEEDFKEVKFQSNFEKVKADFKWYGVAEQINLPKILHNLKVDLTHFPHFNVPIFFDGKFIVTIHDLIHQHFQMNRATTLNPLTYKLKHLGYNHIFKNAINKSDKILTPSNYVKDLLVSEWKIDQNQIVVTQEAVDDKMLTIVNKMKVSESQKILEKWGIKSRYIFYVGNAHPHKNVEGLIKVFRELKDNHPNLQLVLAGADHYFWQRIKQEFNQPDIIYTGQINDEELIALYKNAQVFVMPSFEEGFGIPLLEAMACECPVVSSNAGSLKEVGGEAAVYFNPENLGDMGNKIDQVLRSEKLRTELIEKGKKRVKEFSWKKLAEQTLEVYQQCW